jgi:two-component system, NarL family, sensor kinase
MKPVIVFLFVWMMVSATSLAQPNNQRMLDSMEKLLPVQKDSVLVRTLNELTWQYRLVDREKAIAYGNRAIAMGQQVNYQPGIAQAYNDLGIIFFDKENYDTAIALYGKAMEIRGKMGDKLGIARLYNKIGIIYQKQAIFDKALENQFAALELFKQLKNDIGISYSLNNIGIVNQNLGHYAEAANYQLQSIAIKEKIGDKLGLAGSYVNVGNCYYFDGKSDTAIIYFKKAVVICRALGDKEYLSNALNNMGTSFIELKLYDSALAVVKESFALRESLQDSKGMASCLNNLADAYILTKQYDSANAALQKGMAITANAVNCRNERNMLFKTYSKLYEAKGDMAQALAMHKQYADGKDSLFNDKVSESFAALETKYKTLEQEKKIQEQDFALTKKNYWIAGAVGLLLLASLLGYSYYRRFKLKKEKQMQQAIMKQQDLATKAVIEAEENERKRIAGDLHDGVGQMMSAAKMNLSAFEDRIQFATTEDKLGYEKLIALVDESCKEVRAVSHNMMPNALLKAGLASAVKEFIDKIDSRMLKVNLYSEGLNERLDGNVETVLYRVIQECVNNVIKHSGANQLEISLVKDADGIAATIEDNGKGFDTTQKSKFEGIGLKNIKTRIEYLKGTVDFDSSPGHGTLVAIHVPV